MFFCACIIGICVCVCVCVCARARVSVCVREALRTDIILRRRSAAAYMMGVINNSRTRDRLLLRVRVWVHILGVQLRNATITTVWICCPKSIDWL